MAHHNKRPSSSNEKELPSDMSVEITTPVIVNTGNTQRGVGKPKGTSKSAWGSTFLDRKKFFERGVQKDEDGYLTGDEEDPRPRLTRSSTLPSRRRSNDSSSYIPLQVTDSPQRYPSPPDVSSPITSTSSTVSSTSPHPTTTRFMIDETGQKEGDHSSQSQSDHDGERESGLTDQLDRLETEKRNLEVERERLLNLLEEDRRNCYSPEVRLKDKSRPSHGRIVHRGRETPELVDDRQDGKTTLTIDADKDLLDKINGLLKEKNRLDTCLSEVAEENQSIQREIDQQRKSSLKLQERANDMKKDIDLLRSENSHLSKSLSSAEKEHEEFQLHHQELQGKMDVCEKKQAQMEVLYRKSEQQNQTLKNELSSVIQCRNQLREEKNKLDQEVQEDQKTKQNFRSNIKKLREQNTSLEERLKNVTKEKEELSKEREKRIIEVDRKRLETDKKVTKLETEVEKLKSRIAQLEKDKTSLSFRLDQSTTSGRQLKQQLDEIKWEKEQVEQRLSVVRQNENDVCLNLEQALTEITSYTKEIRNKCSGLNFSKEIELKVSSSRLPAHTDIQTVSRLGSSSPDPFPELKSLKVVHDAVLNEISSLNAQKETLKRKTSQLESLTQKKQNELEVLQKRTKESNRKFDNVKKELEGDLKRNKRSYESEVKATKHELEVVRESLSRLEAEKTDIVLKLQELQTRHQQQTVEFTALQHELGERNEAVSLYHKEVAHLLAQRACITAQAIVSMTKFPIATTEGIHNVEQSSDRITVLLQDRDSLQQELSEVCNKHKSSVSDLEQRDAELRGWQLNTETLKTDFMTEIGLLKSQVSQLEEDKHELQLQFIESKTLGSAFQPVQAPPTQGPRKVTFDPIQEKNQQERLELQHKLTKLDAENKRLQELAHTSSTTMDAGNVLRRQLLDMRKKSFVLESEKKQLTERVHTLHTSLKAMRESKDRMINERVRTLQEENSSLQDCIRSSENMYTKKLMDATTKMAETVKENDKLRHTFRHLQGGLSTIDTLLSSLNDISSQIHTYEEDLATLKASLPGSGGNLSPATEILERVLKTHGEMHSLLVSQVTEENLGRSASLGRPSSGQSVLPPVLQQFSPEYIFSLQGNPSSGKVTPTGRTRTQSHSQSSSIVPNFILQLREKLSHLHADNLSICDLIKHSQESLTARQSDVADFRGKLLSLQTNIHKSMKVMQESHDQLSALSRQDLSPEQLNSIFFLEREVESWQDKVFACDMALKDIEAKMQEDFESHNQRISLLMSQVLDLKEEVSTKRDALLAKDQYINEIEERCLNSETELSKLRKEMNRVMQEALNVPEGFQLSSHGGNIHVSELIRSQNEGLVQLKSAFNECVFQINRLQAKSESLHRDNSILQHQALEKERHHQKILEELYTERDYLRKLNSQLIERQLKPDEVGDMLKKLRRSQETTREQRDIRKMAAELESIKLVIRARDIAIADLQHQLENQQLNSLKLLQSHNSTTEGILVSGHQHKHVVPGRGFSRPLSASSADSARQSRYIITDPNHPRVMNRNQVTSTDGDFFIRLPTSTIGDSVLNLNDSDGNMSVGTYMIGFPVVTDDEGTTTLTETDKSSSKVHQKSKIRRHRRTASAGSDSLKSILSSGSSNSDSRPTKEFNQSSTLPLSVSRQQLQLNFKRPGSVDSMCYELHSPVTVSTTGKTDVNMIGEYAQNIQEQIGQLINKHDNTEEPTVDSKDMKVPGNVGGGQKSSPMKGEKGTVEKSSKGEGLSSKIKGLRKGWKGGGSKTSTVEKEKAVNKSSDSNETNSSDGILNESKLNNPTTYLPDPVSSQKSDEAISSTNSSAQVSRMTSMSSSMGRSDSFASTVSTTFSGVGGESSPYSTLSLDSFPIVDSMEFFHKQETSSKMFPRSSFFTPINQHKYATSSSDEDNCSYGGSRTLKRTSGGIKDAPMQVFQPSLPHHHRTTSSCDSDQLITDTLRAPGHDFMGSSVPLHHNESISISDMDKEQTDQEEVSERIHRLEIQFGKVRRSSTGSITICNHSGSSMEDIKTLGE